MVHLDDIWITLNEDDVLDKLTQRPADLAGLAEALAAFHALRRARGVFDFVPPASSPLPLPEETAGWAAVAATLGQEVEDLPEGPFREPCLRAGLAQLEAFLAYRVRKHFSPRKLHPGFPVVPGGVQAPNLTPAQVLNLFPDNPAGLTAEGDVLRPTWSLVCLYPLSSSAARAASPCASCQKDCALRRR